MQSRSATLTKAGIHKKFTSNTRQKITASGGRQMCMSWTPYVQTLRPQTEWELHFFLGS